MECVYIKICTVTPQVVPRTIYGKLCCYIARCMVPLDQLWLPWMVRFASSGAPAGNQFMVEIPYTRKFPWYVNFADFTVTY